MTALATPGSGCVLSRGSGSGGTAVRASRTIGTTNQQIILYWGTPGTVGNAKTCSIVVSGTNTLFSISVSTSNVTISSATNGGGTATTTVQQAVDALYANATFVANWDVTYGVGDGTGVLVAGTSANLTGGVDGEVFTQIAEVKGVRGPSLAGGVVDVTSFDSTNRVREFIPTLRDSGIMSFTLNYLPNNSGHIALISDMQSGLKRNFTLLFSDTKTTLLSLSGIVTAAEIGAELEQALIANMSLKLTGWPTWTI